jgi:hypothetical protein
MASDADRAYIARLRWRAGLHRLNSDEDGAVRKEQEADLLEQLAAARDKAYAGDGRPKDDSAYRALALAVRSFRFAERSRRELAPRSGSLVATIDNFAEPSDDELLDGAS